MVPSYGQQRHWSDWADAQADMSLCWVHVPFCWFCHEAAQIRNYRQRKLDCDQILHLCFSHMLNKAGFVSHIWLNYKNWKKKKKKKNAHLNCKSFKKLEKKYNIYKKKCCLNQAWIYLDKLTLLKCMVSLWKNRLRQGNLVLTAYASSEGSGEPAHSCSLARTFAARSYKQWVKRNFQRESQIPSPSEWLGMRS